MSLEEVWIVSDGSESYIDEWAIDGAKQAARL
jgi:hypothetical protein